MSPGTPVTSPSAEGLVTTVRRFRAMNTDVTLQVVGPGPRAATLLDDAEQVFVRVERSCTRFDPTSALMQANAAGEQWCEVPQECYLAIAEAAGAHLETEGLFDPRVLTSLVAMGYDRTLPFAEGPVRLSAGRTPDGIPSVVPLTSTPSAGAGTPSAMGPATWAPGLDRHLRAVRVGPRPIDLGGIGKGLAVRWAAHLLVEAGQGYLVEAGGDCALGGPGPDAGPWRVGVEDPLGGDDPVAVLEITDIGCATSSLRKRTWQIEGRQVHHLVDPRTGISADTGLRSVTVLDSDTARAEVWSKALLIAGRHRIAELAESKVLPALWVDETGRLEASEAIRDDIIWSASHVH
ncbi:MAG: FAD:protein FMN transferase [Kineosporiaceae bacterium]